jgi:hypothetical protein
MPQPTPTDAVQAARAAAQAAAAVPARWTTALSTVIGSFGPRSWDDVENTVDHILTGDPAVPPPLRGGRSIELTLGGYESAHRIVLAGLCEVAPAMALRWARLRTGLRGVEARTMTPIAGGVIETLLSDLAEMFGAPGRRVPLDVLVLEDLVEAAGVPASAVLLAAFQPGPDAADAMPSRACQTLCAMRGYDEALTRHAAAMRLHILGFDPHGQVRAARMLEQAANPTLRVYAEVIAAMGDSRDAAIRAAARPLAQRIQASRPQPQSVPAIPTPRAAGVPGWANLGHRLVGDATVPGLEP